MSMAAKSRLELVQAGPERHDLFAEFTDSAVLNIHALENEQMTPLFGVYAHKKGVMARNCLDADADPRQNSYTRSTLLSFLTCANFSELEFMDEFETEIRPNRGSVASNAGSLPKACPYDPPLVHIEN